MKRAVGYFLLTIGFLINWPLQIGISIYGIYFIVRAFLDGSILIGIIALILTPFLVGITHFIVGLILLPLNGLGMVLIGKLLDDHSNNRLNIPFTPEAQSIVDAKREETLSQIERIHKMRVNLYIKEGMSSVEAELKVKQEDDSQVIS